MPNKFLIKKTKTKILFFLKQIRVKKLIIKRMLQGNKIYFGLLIKLIRNYLNKFIKTAPGKLKNTANNNSKKQYAPH